MVLDIRPISKQEEMRCFVAISRAYPATKVFVATTGRDMARSLATSFLDKELRCAVSYYGMRAWRFELGDWLIKDMVHEAFLLDEDRIRRVIQEKLSELDQYAEDLYYKSAARSKRRK